MIWRQWICFLWHHVCVLCLVSKYDFWKPLKSKFSCTKASFIMVIAAWQQKSSCLYLDLIIIWKSLVWFCKNCLICLPGDTLLLGKARGQARSRDKMLLVLHDDDFISLLLLTREHHITFVQDRSIEHQSHVVVLVYPRTSSPRLHQCQLLSELCRGQGRRWRWCNISGEPRSFNEFTGIFNIQDGCMKALQHQVRIEFEASLQYILMAAHFDQVSDILLILPD